MPPHEGLVHPTSYDWRDSNVSLINSDLDHNIKHTSAESEPAWNNGIVGAQPGLFVWRIEDFQVVPWPREKYGEFYEGDSYIILKSEKVEERGDGDGEGEGEKEREKEKLVHDIFFWLGSRTSLDEAGTAAYKTVELDEFLQGSATQHRELQSAPSDAFAQLFPRLKILRGGVRTGFTHVETDERKEHVDTLLRVFKHPSAAAGRDGVLIHEVEPTYRSLDENDVFILDRGDKIFVWQGKKCAAMEKAKAAQVVNDMTIAKHVDVEVLSQNEARSKVVVDYLGGEHVNLLETQFKAPRPVSLPSSRRDEGGGAKEKKLFRLSDADGELSLDLVKESRAITRGDFDDGDVFVLDDGRSVWVWEGSGASKTEKGMWLRVVQTYLGGLGEEERERKGGGINKVGQGHEGRGFWGAVEA